MSAEVGDRIVETMWNILLLLSEQSEVESA